MLTLKIIIVSFFLTTTTETSEQYNLKREIAFNTQQAVVEDGFVIPLTESSLGVSLLLSDIVQAVRNPTAPRFLVESAKEDINNIKIFEISSLANKKYIFILDKKHQFSTSEILSNIDIKSRALVYQDDNSLILKNQFDQYILFKIIKNDSHFALLYADRLQDKKALFKAQRTANSVDQLDKVKGNKLAKLFANEPEKVDQQYYAFLPLPDYTKALNAALEKAFSPHLFVGRFNSSFVFRNPDTQLYQEPNYGSLIISNKSMSDTIKAIKKENSDHYNVKEGSDHIVLMSSSDISTLKIFRLRKIGDYTIILSNDDLADLALKLKLFYHLKNTPINISPPNQQLANFFKFFEYARVNQYDDTILRVTKKHEGSNVHGLLNIARGELVVPVIYQDIRSEKYGYRVKKDDKQGWLDSEGKVVVSIQYFDIWANEKSPQLLTVRDKRTNKDSYGAFSLKTNTFTVPVEYDMLEYTPDASGYMIVEKDDQYGLFREDGTELISTNYRLLRFINSELYMAAKGDSSQINTYHLYDNNGKQIDTKHYTYFWYDSSKNRILVKYKEGEKTIRRYLKPDGKTLIKEE